MNMNIIHLQKLHPKIPPTTLVLKYISIFSYSMPSIKCHKYTSCVLILQFLLEFFCELINISLKLIKYFLKVQKNLRYNVHMNLKLQNAKKLYL
jgi:hypothetical protein